MKQFSRIHLTGIKGVGMTALAICLQDMGKKISGSDVSDIFPTDKILKTRKISWKTGFSEDHLPKNCDLVIYTGAHNGAANPEVKAAKDRNILTLNYAQALARLVNHKKLIATAGVGGKSTTAAMLATLLDSAGLNPSFSVGVGNITNLKTPARYDKDSKLFVVESDEYVADPQTDLTPKFHYLTPEIAIITNIEHDHPDVYPTLEAVFKSYTQFVNSIPESGHIIANLDSPHLQQFIRSLNRPVITYGFTPQADWQITRTHTADKKQFFSLKAKDADWPDFILNVPGQYNVLNAAAAAVAAYQLGVSAKKIQLGLKAYTGTQRRFQHIATVKGIDLYDDYAHHPLEIQALLKAAKDWLPGKRIFIIFQSHTYSRTRVLLDQFAKSFNQAHAVVINNIFPSARETDNQGMTGEVLTQAIKNHYSQVHYCPGKPETIKFLLSHLQKGDAVFTVGAGDNWLWHKDIIKAIKQKL